MGLAGGEGLLFQQYMPAFIKVFDCLHCAAYGEIADCQLAITVQMHLSFH
jgi:hypothetical protein